MKKYILIIGIFTATIAGASLLTSCGGSQTNQTTTEHNHSQSDEMAEADSSFVCPMHPEIKGKEGDKCSKCGMALVSHKESEHDHQH